MALMTVFHFRLFGLLVACVNCSVAVFDNAARVDYVSHGYVTSFI